MSLPLHPERLRALWQLPILILLLNACASTPAPSTPSLLPPGFYVFDCPIVYERGMARLDPHPRGARVQLLEGVRGSFELHVAGDDIVRIRNAQMDYPGLRRSFSGEGRITAVGHANGEAESWIMNFGFAGRDHRTGTWELRPASESEIQRHQRRERTLEERKRRAGIAEDQ